jgi:hypothetical protein
MLKLIPEWKTTLRYAWSIRFAALTGLLGGIEAFLPLFSDSFPRGIFALLCVVTSLVGALSRFVMQKKMREPDGLYHTDKP